MNDLESEIIKLNERIENLTLEIKSMRNHIYIIYFLIISFAVIVFISTLHDTTSIVLVGIVAISGIFLVMFYLVFKYSNDEHGSSNK